MLSAWESSLIIDHGEIDRDHKYLFALSERIAAADRIAVHKDVMAALLREFVDFSAIHFSREEDLMNRLGYPERAAHGAAHDAYYARLCQLASAFEKGVSDIRSRLTAFIGTYSYGHIDTHDRALAAWCSVSKSNSRHETMPESAV